VDGSRPPDRVPESSNLDAIRAIAVLCVFGGHTAHTGLGLENDWVWRFDQMGVLIFFVHTSLVLMRSLDRADGSTRSLFPAFYIRRAFRIYPLSVVCVLTAYICSYSPDSQGGFSRRWTLGELAANATLTQNLFYVDGMWGGLWTLPLEVQMYVCLPFLYVAFRRRQPGWLVALWAISVPIAVVQQAKVGRLGILGYLPCFLGGVIAWRLEDRVRPRFPALFFPGAVACVSVAWLTTGREYNMYHRWVFCLLLGLTLPHFEDLRSPWIVRPAKVLAKYSYGIYMSHTIALAIAFGLITGVAPPVRWVVFAIFAIALPFLMYHVVENPMIRLGQRIAKRVSASRPGRPDSVGERVASATGVP
jgi:peptidoglycan/LPS O-acetylase OafA/YrhL